MTGGQSPAMINSIDPQRAILGIACTFGKSIGGWTLQPDQFERWLALEPGLDMRINHGNVIDHHGCIATIGRWRAFKIITQPVHGLLALGEIDSARGFGDQMLHDLHLIFEQRWLPRDYWGLSIACHVFPDEGEFVWPYECSLTRRPADPDAAVLGVGPEAISRWQLLTETREAAA